jgi:hypothetical protein
MLAQVSVVATEGFSIARSLFLNSENSLRYKGDFIPLDPRFSVAMTTFDLVMRRSTMRGSEVNLMG